ncbi:hypothetical protein JOB18_000160 [Solea senegalensis]|uniref:Uncharacterized protein n=1 Tax=Solea senegalensis TaxID=28829 RepID=A0AAV6RWL7_SOLSE|nr:hypothetical protein JOB18_000160 [Solea senegalensis]
MFRAALSSVASGWQCQAVPRAVSPGSLIILYGKGALERGSERKQGLQRDWSRGPERPMWVKPEPDESGDATINIERCYGAAVLCRSAAPLHYAAFNENKSKPQGDVGAIKPGETHYVFRNAIKSYVTGGFINHQLDSLCQGELTAFGPIRRCRDNRNSTSCASMPGAKRCLPVIT